MSRIRLLLCLFVLFAQHAAAQQLKFGYFSYQDVLTSMSSYAAVQENMKELRSKYEAETKRSEEEFNQKYEDFLEGVQDYAPSILKKRQAELQDYMARNIAFKEESERLLKQAETDAMVPVRKQLDDAVRSIAIRNGYAFVMNTDDHALPYIDESMGEDITQQLLMVLR